MPFHDAALLLLGHGSTLNADSSAPTYQHAEEIRHRNIFAEVHVGFWKEEPNFRQALRQTRQRRVFVVPNFISNGYFTEQIIPRELGLVGSVTKLGKQTVYYCDPVGLHTSMTEALLRRAHEVVAQSTEEISAPEKTACLFICGHGTSLNDNSTKIIHEQVEIIRAKKIYADCQPVLMEQRPFVKDWRTLTDCPDVIVVPFFISDGLHSFEDIPVLLGLRRDKEAPTWMDPHHEKGRRLWYANAIGTEPAIADVILAQVTKFRKEHRGIWGRASSGSNPCFPRFRAFSNKNDAWTIGQLLIRHEGGPFYSIIHKDDSAEVTDTLQSIGLENLQEIITRDFDGRFRPLRAAPDLRRGWILHAFDCSSVQAMLDYVYPAEIANWSMWKHNQLPATPWNETAERQSGRFRVVREIDDAGIKDLTAQICDPGCLKRRLWAPAGQTVDARRDEIALLCPEACNYLVAKAREKLKGPDEE